MSWRDIQIPDTNLLKETNNTWYIEECRIANDAAHHFLYFPDAMEDLFPGNASRIEEWGRMLGYLIKEGNAVRGVTNENVTFYTIPMHVVKKRKRYSLMYKVMETYDYQKKLLQAAGMNVASGSGSGMGGGYQQQLSVPDPDIGNSPGWISEPMSAASPGQYQVPVRSQPSTPGFQVFSGAPRTPYYGPDNPAEVEYTGVTYYGAEFDAASPGERSRLAEGARLAYEAEFHYDYRDYMPPSEPQDEQGR